MQKNAPILITGAGGFIGKNLVAALRQQGYGNLLLFEKADTPDTLRPVSYTHLTLPTKA